MDQELLSNIDVAKHNGILRLFIGFVQRKSLYEVEESSEEDCVTVLNWLSSNQIDVNKKDWCRTEDGNYLPQLQGNMSVNNFLYWILKLKSMLPILLKCNGNIQFIDENGKTILHVFLEDYLAIYDSLEKEFSCRNHHMIEYLMCKGISVEAADQNGNTPLHIAAKHRKIYIVKIMLDNYLNVNACNNQGDTVLHILCSEVSDKSTTALIEQCAQSMLVKGADVNLQNEMGWTPVHFAAKCNYPGVLKIFLYGGANLDLLTNDGESPLLLACKYALFSHAESTSNTLVKLLVNSGCNVNETDKNGYSPLHYACNSYRTMVGYTFGRVTTASECISPSVSGSALKPLVEAGADVNGETVDGATPLFLVTSSMLSGAVEYLSQQGADVFRRERIFGFTALHMAALQFDESKLEYFLEQGLDVNDGGNYGITALHLASFRGNLQLMKMLIARGADVHCRDNVTRSTALHFVAKEGPVLDYVGLICDVERKPLWNPSMFTVNYSEAAIALLVQHGVDVNAKDVYGRTPLHLATMYAGEEEVDDPILSVIMDHLKDVDPIRGLLMCGAYVDVQDDDGNLPLHNALKTEHEKALGSLLEFGVDVNGADTSRIVLSCKENLKGQVLRYLVKLRAAELPVFNAYSFHANDPEFQSLYNVCLDEVEEMKSILLDDTTSLYDLLRIGRRRRSNFALKLPADLKDKFPLYARIIQGSCREAVLRNSLLEPARFGWYRITGVNLPDVCVERILAHLKNRYLRVLAEGLSEDNL